jgi:beta-fructofuranosidase
MTTDRSFPTLHPRPAKGWVNDPNGIQRIDGRWHLFFQYNPESARHADITWGHVSSTDLVRWEEHPIALRPQAGGPDSAGCFSGVGAVIDGTPTAIYSGIVAHDGMSTVIIERGSADALAWEQTGHVAAGLPSDPEVTMVRDPFLFDVDGRRWALQGASLSGDEPALLLYDADDIDAWEEHGVFLTAADVEGLPDCDGWECPQLVRVGDDWVLLVSLWEPGRSPLERHQGVGYVVGSLTMGDAGVPVFAGRASGILDLGASFYAPQAVQASDPERVLVWGWAQETRPQEESDRAGWSGMLTFPRELRVHGDTVELDALRAGSVDPAALPDQAEAVLTGSGTASLSLGGDVVWGGEVSGELRILIDGSIIEVHPAATASYTERAYPTAGDAYAVSVSDGVSVAAYSLALPAA